MTQEREGLPEVCGMYWNECVGGVRLKVVMKGGEKSERNLREQYSMMENRRADLEVRNISPGGTENGSP